MSGFAAVCPVEITNKFTTPGLNPTTFLSGSTFNTAAWGAVQGADAFPKVIPKKSGTAAEDSDSYRVYTVTPKQVNPSVPATPLTISLFSILKMVTSIPAFSQRYNDPADTFYWNSKGIRDLDSTDLTNIYNTIKSNKIPTSSGTSAQDLKNIIVDMKLSDLDQGSPLRYSVSLDLIYSANFEYCYWASIFRKLLNDIFTVNTLPAVTEAEKRKFLNAAASVNQRLNDLTTILNDINSKQETELGNIITSTNVNINSINDATKRMNNALNTISSKDGIAKLRSRMVEYNEEKNNYASTLLSLYGFANLVALGLLFYIYKS